MFDSRCTSSLLFLCLLEVVHTGWVYGTHTFFDNLAEMGMDFGSPLRILWSLLWKLVTPAVLSKNCINLIQF